MSEKIKKVLKELGYNHYFIDYVIEVNDNKTCNKGDLDFFIIDNDLIWLPIKIDFENFKKYFENF